MVNLMNSKVPRVQHTTQFIDSYHSTKCIGLGNNRKASLVTAKLRRQVNKKRRRFLKKLMEKDNET